jgi:capsular exopolysaccharide synthesis family protein
MASTDPRMGNHYEPSGGNQDAMNGNGLPMPVNGAANGRINTLMPAGVAMPASAADGSRFFKALRRRWLAALTFGVAAAVAAAAVAWFLVPVRYTATATLRAPMQSPYSLAPSPESKADYVTFQRTQKELLKYRFVLNAALNKPGLIELPTLQEHSDDMIGWLDKQIVVTFPSGTELLRVSMVGQRPDDLKEIIDAVTRAYIDEVVELDRKAGEKRLKDLESIQPLYDKRRNKQWEDLFHLAGKEELGTGETQTLALQQQALNDSMAAAQKELDQISVELRQRHLRLREVQAREKSLAAESLSPAVLDAQADKDPRIVELNKQKAQSEQRLAGDLRVATQGEKDLRVLRSRDAIKLIDAQLEKRLSELRPEMEKAFKGKKALELRAEATGLYEQIEYLEHLKTTDQKQLSESAQKSRAKGTGALAIEKLRHDISETEHFLNRINEQIRALKAEQNADRRVDIVEKAVVSSWEGEKRQLLAMAAAGIGALLLVVGIVGWLEFRVGRIDSPDSVIRDLGLRVVGTLPVYRKGMLARVVKSGAVPPTMSHHLMQSIDAAATLLLHAVQGEKVRVVMITSAVAGEGKTSVACHLGPSLARAGCKTLLLDCDLHRSAVHHVFDVPNNHGISELLRQEMNVKDVIRATPEERLHIIPAGTSDERAIRALTRGGLRTILAGVRESYDVILVDSCPVLLAADSLAIALQVDGVLFSVMSEVSRLPRVQAAYQRLAMLNVPLLGAVVNGARDGLYDSAYEYGQVSVG